MITIQNIDKIKGMGLMVSPELPPYWAETEKWIKHPSPKES